MIFFTVKQTTQYSPFTSIEARVGMRISKYSPSCFVMAPLLKTMLSRGGNHEKIYSEFRMAELVCTVSKNRVCPCRNKKEDQKNWHVAGHSLLTRCFFHDKSKVAVRKNREKTIHVFYFP